jgi:hypothetical protein
MKRIYLLLIGSIIGIIITGFFFSSVSRSGEQGDYFYTCLKAGDYEKIIDLMDKEALKTQAGKDWLQVFSSRTKEFGPLVSYKNIGFHTETIQGKSITKLDYDVVYLSSKTKEHIDFIKRGSEYKILSYEYTQDIGNSFVSK